MNIKTLLIAAGILVSVSTQATGVNEKFLKAIHLVESSGRTGAIVGDSGKALGPLQIHKEYFQDAAEYDKSLGNNYNKVADLTFAKKVVTAYLNRYAPKAVSSNDFKTLARIHNGGPKGFKYSSTIQYWAKVEKNLK